MNNEQGILNKEQGIKNKNDEVWLLFWAFVFIGAWVNE